MSIFIVLDVFSFWTVVKKYKNKGSKLQLNQYSNKFKPELVLSKCSYHYRLLATEAWCKYFVN